MGFKLVYGGRPNLWLGQFDIFPENLFTHGISSRNGGVSKEPWSSLNLGLHVEDNRAAVLENRKIFCQALGLEAEKIITCQQVHGNIIAKVTAGDCGAGAMDFGTSIETTDALITNEPQVPLMLFFADCTPILLADPVTKAIGIAHGGWKGTLGAIAEKTVLAMGEHFGCKPENMLAAIAPSIGSCCYQVGSEVAEKFRQGFPEFAAEILLQRKDGIYLDLQRTNTLQLQRAGLKTEHIENAHVCTACNNRQFFSYRADGGQTGRIAAVMCIK